MAKALKMDEWPQAPQNTEKSLNPLCALCALRWLFVFIQFITLRWI